MEQVAAIVGAALGAGGLGAVLAYLSMRRRTSGSVATTDADRLWLQNDKLIDAYARDNSQLRERITIQDQRIYSLEQENRECNRRTELLETRLQAAEQVLNARLDQAEAKATIVEQGREIADLKRTSDGGGTA